MFIYFQPPGGSSTQAGSPAPRWRAVFMTVALALAIGSAGFTVPAQAQDSELHQVDVINAEPNTVCVRQSRDYRVRISQLANASIQLGLGTTITPQVADPGIIEFTGGHNDSINNPDPGSMWPHVVVLTFKAKKEGQTKITFSADVVEFGHTFKARPYTVDVNVQECKFKISIRSKWGVPGLQYIAYLDDTELKPDANGNYAGTAKVTWLGYWDVIPPGVGKGLSCFANLTAPASLAYVTGKLNDSGYLEVNVTYGSSAASWSAFCKDSSGSTPLSNTPVQLTAESLKITVPTSTGGVSSQEQELTGQIDRSGSSAYVDIYPDVLDPRP